VGVRDLVRVGGTEDQKASLCAGHQRGRVGRAPLLAVAVTDNTIESTPVHVLIHGD
jgi:hypothetical protein